MSPKLRLISRILLNTYPKLYFTLKGIKYNSFFTDKTNVKKFINKYNGNIDIFLLDNFPEIFWQRRAHWERLYKNIQDVRFLKILKNIIIDGNTLMSIEEIYNLYRLVTKSARVEGSLAEVGVYKGGSARIICEAKGNRTLYLFDTFEGIPEITEGLDIIPKGYCSDTSLESVKGYLSAYENVHLIKGIFPESANYIKGIKFSFVNLDVDTYITTLNCLGYFYSRMEKGGFILSHDYLLKGTPGVTRAFNEFFIDKPETVIELWTTQCLVIKC